MPEGVFREFVFRAVYEDIKRFAGYGSECRKLFDEKWGRVEEVRWVDQKGNRKCLQRAMLRFVRERRRFVWGCGFNGEVLQRFLAKVERYDNSCAAINDKPTYLGFALYFYNKMRSAMV